MKCREREIQCRRLKPNFLTLQKGAGGPGYIGKSVGKKGGKWISNFPPKVQPPGYTIWGETKYRFVMYQRRGARPAWYLSCRWPAGPPHGRPAKGQKGQVWLVAGHHRLVASHVSSTQPCG